MPRDKISIILPILIITLGVGWLLTTRGIIPEVNWIWTLGLAVMGLLVFAMSGIDKFSIVLGPLLLLASVFSVLRQTERMSIDLEVPILVIVLGGLMLAARFAPLPLPRWVQPPGPGDGR